MSLYFAPDSVATEWALSTIAGIEAAPHLAIEAAIETAIHDPTSMISLRRELERSDAAAWQAIKRGYLYRLAAHARATGKGNPCARIHTALTRQSVASVIQAILSVGERQRLREFLQILRSASRVKPLGSDRIQQVSLRAIKARSGSAFLAQLRKTASSARLLQSADEWLNLDIESPDDLSCLEAVLSGNPVALQAGLEMRKFPPGDWRWRVLLGSLVSAMQSES